MLHLHRALHLMQCQRKQGRNHSERNFSPKLTVIKAEAAYLPVAKLLSPRSKRRQTSRKPSEIAVKGGIKCLGKPLTVKLRVDVKRVTLQMTHFDGNTFPCGKG